MAEIQSLRRWHSEASSQWNTRESFDRTVECCSVRDRENLGPSRSWTVHRQVSGEKEIRIIRGGE